MKGDKNGERSYIHGELNEPLNSSFYLSSTSFRLLMCEVHLVLLKKENNNEKKNKY